jgi:hypothetical protein
MLTFQEEIFPRTNFSLSGYVVSPALTGLRRPTVRSKTGTDGNPWASVPMALYVLAAVSV